MTEVRLQIPDDQVAFFLELVNKLGFEAHSGLDIHEKHKELVRNRIAKQPSNDLLVWKEAVERLKFE